MTGEVKSFLYVISLIVGIFIPLAFAYFVIDEDNFIKRHKRRKMEENFYG